MQRYFPDDLNEVSPSYGRNTQRANIGSRSNRNYNEFADTIASQYASTDAAMIALEEALDKAKAKYNNMLNKFVDKWQNYYSIEKITEALEIANYDLNAASVILNSNY